MPMYLTTDGMDDIQRTLALAGDRAQGVAAMALYEGAGLIADAISSGARNIRTSPFKYATNGKQRDPSPEEKDILLQNSPAGIAKFDKSGNFVGTSVGYNGSGYATVNWNHMRGNSRTNYKIKGGQNVWSGKAYLEWGSDGHAVRNRGKGGLANSKPVGVIANAINSGTSFMKKQPFIRQAISKSKAAAMAKIQQTAEQLVDSMFKSA